MTRAAERSGSLKRKTIWIVLVALFTGAALLVFSQMKWAEPARPRGENVDAVASAAEPEPGVAQDAPSGEDDAAENADDEDDAQSDGDEEDDAEDEAEEKTEEDIIAEEEEKAVESFDSMTDQWMEPGGREVTMEHVNDFAKRFKQIPDRRKEECLQRALNLLPDDNVMLLAGILLDKSLEKEYLELVFNDVLNRDEDVKKPILSEIYKDREHPCWAETAWILDATGESPKPDQD